ncbi:hypothetical protein [Methanopyrus sp.]
MGELADQIRKHAVPTLVNGLGAVLTVAFAQLLVPMLSSLGSAIPGIGVPVNTMVTVGVILLFFYFLYQTIRHLAPIVNAASDLLSELVLGERDENVRTATYNLVLAIVAILAAVLLSPLVVPLPGLGAVLSVIVLVAGLGVGALFLVKAAKGYYSAFKEKMEELSERLAEWAEELEERAKRAKEEKEEKEAEE